MSYLSLSTWSLHRLLGPLRWTAWDAEGERHIVNEQEQPENLTLLQLPAEAAKRGYAALEICHFHFPSTEPDYLNRLREAFQATGVRFDTLLLDYGDLTLNDSIRLTADLALIRAWIDAASLAGAKQIRIVAGERDGSDKTALAQSARHLRDLAAYANGKNVNVVTENFKALTATGEHCRELVTLTEPEVQWITDFGNFSGARKYEELEMILTHSVSVHAKAQYDDRGWPDRAEFERCLDRAIGSGFNGAYVLIYDGPGDMWEGLERIKTIVETRLRG
ncbi:sugar phosphate isomerase/epimerase [Cohnella ginsengisoli]|uniref:Sugar phosphate isomerase/epimerase n=1 Tax=Cohnella ginsengisoli TaxID=425004 RepID=A0A9X4QM61_9BACL|nr:TIM barrel protein [Cohnella ginsengisoli]MDG0791358.1 sugar phosphate isomerase/epimerase [Cohnella ginsengisoli]